MPANSLAQTLNVLQRLSAPVEALTGGVVNRFSRTLAALGRIAAELDLPIAIVGGLAAIHHRVAVTTLDIDIVVAGEELDRFLEGAVGAGFTIKRRSPRGWHRLEFPDEEGAVEVEVIPAGQTSPRDPAFAPPTPAPPELGVPTGLDFASFAAWVVLKLVANRDKDRYHMVEALKRATPEEVAAVVVRLKTLDATYLREFERLVDAAEQERQDEW